MSRRLRWTVRWRAGRVLGCVRMMFQWPTHDVGFHRFRHIRGETRCLCGHRTTDDPERCTVDW